MLNLGVFTLGHLFSAVAEPMKDHHLEIISNATLHLSFKLTSCNILQIYGMGTNCSGCLGIGSNMNFLEPRPIEDLTGMKIVAISAGSGPHVLTLTKGALKIL